MSAAPEADASTALDAGTVCAIMVADCLPVLLTDAELDAAFPGQRAARVEIRLRDGRVLSCLQPFRKGDPEAPLSDRELEQKYRELADPVLGSEAAGALLEKLYRLDELPGLETL